jgi:hypothetical protein
MMMPFGGLSSRSIVSLQELIERRFLETFFFGLRIECFHFVQLFL